MSSSSEQAENVLCRYYMNGACRDGSICRFSHNRNDRPSMICRYYQKGSCAYGGSCRFDHVRADHSNSQRRSNFGGAASSSNSKQNPEQSKCSTSNPTNNMFSASSCVDELARKSKLRVDAHEFVPQSFNPSKKEGLSYSEMVSGQVAQPENGTTCVTGTKDLLCPYNLMGHCWYGDMCSYAHGEMCDLCNKAVLHPTNKEQNAKHRQECLAEHEREMETAFAMAKGKEKQCGICMEVVLEKTDPTTQRFGVLPNCKHCFCLECIRKWRQAKSFENKIIRACPECRTLSDYVVPSSVWVEEDDEKQALIETYQFAMKEKKCKYFKEGNDECPFGNKCFYRHVKPDGTLVVGDSPRSIRRRLRQRRGGRRFNGAGTSTATDLYVLWQFLEERDALGDRGRDSVGSADWLWDELEYELDMLSVTDDSDSDDDEYFNLVLS